jgi:hypothetical protein
METDSFRRKVDEVEGGAKRVVGNSPFERKPDEAVGGYLKRAMEF